MLNFIQNNAENIVQAIFLFVVSMLFILWFMIFDSEDEPPGFT